MLTRLLGERRGIGTLLREEQCAIGVRGIGVWHLVVEKKNLMLKFL
jgi:hypothetical protein